MVTTKGKLVKYPRNKPEFLAVDKIPNRQDVRPGSRVVAQWHDRDEPYYLATVQGRLGHNKYLLVFDDDDEAYCDLKNIRVLLWTTSALGDGIVKHLQTYSSAYCAPDEITNCIGLESRQPVRDNKLLDVSMAKP